MKHKGFNKITLIIAGNVVACYKTIEEANIAANGRNICDVIWDKLKDTKYTCNDVKELKMFQFKNEIEIRLNMWEI